MFSLEPSPLVPYPVDRVEVRRDMTFERPIDRMIALGHIDFTFLVPVDPRAYPDPARRDGRTHRNLHHGARPFPPMMGKAPASPNHRGVTNETAEEDLWVL
jgi:hypothetical protein